mmetsp:Transcript_105605/g.294779  ORF Transcript_105605/g.294779 Transcript_105605/m.294779 type:complete len:328 (-) Transcript_105605:2-985(-)
MSLLLLSVAEPYRFILDIANALVKHVYHVCEIRRGVDEPTADVRHQRISFALRHLLDYGAQVGSSVVELLRSVEQVCGVVAQVPHLRRNYVDALLPVRASSHQSRGADHKHHDRCPSRPDAPTPASRPSLARGLVLPPLHGAEDEGPVGTSPRAPYAIEKPVAHGDPGEVRHCQADDEQRGRGPAGGRQGQLVPAVPQLPEPWIAVGIAHGGEHPEPIAHLEAGRRGPLVDHLWHAAPHVWQVRLSTVALWAEASPNVAHRALGHARHPDAPAHHLRLARHAVFGTCRPDATLVRALTRPPVVDRRHGRALLRGNQARQPGEHSEPQ